MTLDKQADLINHVWRNCLNSKDGKALFHGNTLAKEFLSTDENWLAAFSVLRRTPEIKIRAFYIDGLIEKIFEASINPIYCKSEYKKLSQRLAEEDAAYFLEKKREQENNFNKEAYYESLRAMVSK